MGRIIRLQINKEKGQPPIPVETLTAYAGDGIEGDRHSGGWKGKENTHERDVCICRKELVDWMKEQPIQGLCFPRHKENLLIEGFRAEELMPGTRLAGREVVLEISDFPKHCFPEGCDLAKAGIYCQFRREYQMCRIVNSGTFQIGEELQLLSDRGEKME